MQAAWLLQQCGLDVPNPKDHEDPHGICATLMAAARRLGFAPPSYAPTKLTGGWGREVCALLWALADAVIARRRVSPARPVYRQDSERGEAEGDGADQGSEVGWGRGGPNEVPCCGRISMMPDAGPSRGVHICTNIPQLLLSWV